LPVDTTFTLELAEDVCFRYRAVREDAIGRALHWKGGDAFEPETLWVFCQLARRANVVLDVGANTGIYALAACAANPKAQVIAFEPVPEVFAILSDNVSINNWADRCILSQCAVADFVGTTEFHVPYDELPSSASLHRDGFHGYPGQLIQRQATTIDRFVHEREQIDLVKIDVEGFEDKVLHGMRDVLALHRPSIVVECNPDGPYAAVQQILFEYGYQLYHLRGEGPKAVTSIVPDREERHRNFLCIARGLQEVGLSP